MEGVDLAFEGREFHNFIADGKKDFSKWDVLAGIGFKLCRFMEHML